MIRILIADDHNLFREGIINLLSTEKDMAVVGEAEDGLALIVKYDEIKPDIVLSDISMPVRSGPDAIRVITNNNPDAKILFLSQFTGDDYIYSVLKARGNGLISKNVMRNELLLAIRTVANGGKYFIGKTEEELKDILTRFNVIKKETRAENTELLTDKEEEILLLISESLSSVEIAQKLKVSRRTIDSHRLNIINKLNLKSLPGLINFAQAFAHQEREKN